MKITKENLHQLTKHYGENDPDYGSITSKQRELDKAFNDLGDAILRYFLWIPENFDKPFHLAEGEDRKFFDLGRKICMKDSTIGNEFIRIESQYLHHLIHDTMTQNEPKYINQSVSELILIINSARMVANFAIVMTFRTNLCDNVTL